ncbi:unnamed protein product [Penicillium olsonii]|uniref:Uncharacterized protein n=1 Tax=Penicillium olsonii TaxID=99116 RepID=A0A9W4HM57_PENOL|nr:unnamed protein product [Penicillium olsonii]CAG8287358.1 unnamed protein product [Penicillium olsonii]
MSHVYYITHLIVSCDLECGSADPWTFGHVGGSRRSSHALIRRRDRVRNDLKFPASSDEISTHLLLTMAPQLEASIKALSRMLCWSGSFYPQPLTNWERKSTLGLSIDLCAINPIGFISYAIYTSAFLYSPVIRAQYAARHPVAAEPTVRFNDFAFAAHAVVLSTILYTHFWPSIWGFYVGRFQRISRSMALIWWGCALTPVVVMGVVMTQSPDRGYDASSWAWIDVVSTKPAPAKYSGLENRERQRKSH